MKAFMGKVNSLVDMRSDSIIKNTRLMVDGKGFRYPYKKMIVSDSSMMKKLEKLDSQYKKTYIRTLLVRIFWYMGVALSLIGLFVSVPKLYWIIVMLICLIAGLMSVSNFLLLIRVLRKDGLNYPADPKWSPVVSLGVSQVIDEDENYYQNRIDKDNSLNIEVVGNEMIDKLSDFVLIEIFAVILFVFGLICYYNGYSSYTAYFAVPSILLMINCLFWVEAFKYYSILVSFYRSF